MNNSSLSSAQACYKKWSAINAKGYAYAHRIEAANMCDAQCPKKCDATWRRNPNLASAHACYEKWTIINQNSAEARRIEIRNTQNWNELDSAEKLRRQQRVKH
jgi:hypothetical protein